MNEEKQSYFAQKMKAMRLERNQTQQQMADLIGLSRACIANYENGNRRPSVENIKKLALYFHITLDELLYPQSDSIARQYIDVTKLDPQNRIRVEEYTQQLQFRQELGDCNDGNG